MINKKKIAIIIILKLFAPCGKCKGNNSSDDLYLILKLNIRLYSPGGISDVIAKPFDSSIKLPSEDLFLRINQKNLQVN